MHLVVTSLYCKLQAKNRLIKFVVTLKTWTLEIDMIRKESLYDVNIDDIIYLLYKLLLTLIIKE